MFYAQNYLKMDKIYKLLNAIEYIDRYSDQEIEAILADAEVRDMYNTLDKTKASLSTIVAPDVDAEWREFERLHKKRSFGIFNLFSHNIAASIAICIASLAAAAVVGVSVNYALDKKEESKAKETSVVAKKKVIHSDSVIVADETGIAAPEIVVFDNEPFGTIMNRIAEYYGYDTEFATDAPMSLRLYFRWNQSHTLDEVIESLNNFEQIDITVKDKIIKIG